MVRVESEQPGVDVIRLRTQALASAFQAAIQAKK